MAKGFSENEKKIIKDRLIGIAQECWDKYGIKKTSVDEIAKMAGISKGAFYLFYQSKELLFLDVLARLDKRIKDAMLETLTKAQESKKQRFINGIAQMVFEVQKSPWIINLQNGDYDLLIQKLPAAAVQKHLSIDEADVTLLLRRLDVDCDSGFVSSVMRAIFFTLLHKEEIGGARFDEVLQFLIESLADRIFDGRRQP